MKIVEDRYAVVGHPIAHSRSPQIHAAFAQATGQSMSYERILAPLDQFAATLSAFRAAGGRGVNVTVPFKLEAFAYANQRTARAQAAQAVNTLRFDAESILGDNTDGAGLVTDLIANHGVVLQHQRVLLLGAGGAAQGVLLPLLETHPACLVIANRSKQKAHALAARYSNVTACGIDELAGESFDVVINATSAGLHGATPNLPRGIYATHAFAYDMLYGAHTPFLQSARAAGVQRVADGLGMLVEQAAESFLLWRGIRPPSQDVLAALRANG